MFVTCNSATATTFTLQSTKLHFLLLLLLLLFFLLTPTTTPLNFSFSSFNGSDLTTISTEGNAYFDNEFLRFTQSAPDVAIEGSVGLATYRQPFLLRENATGKLADFTSSFTFSMDSNNNSIYGDRLTFFISPNGSSLKGTIAGGIGVSPFDGSIMPSSSDTNPTNQYPFVAVEFDIYENAQPTINDDPLYNRVGIDVNSLDSVIYQNWSVSYNSILNGIGNSVTVSYNSTSKNLSVAYTTVDEDDVEVINYLDYMVDLKDYLPDWVVVGFSASTGRSVSLFKIVSWNFNSTSLVDHHKVDIPTNTTSSVVAVLGPSTVASAHSPKPGNDRRIGHAIGISIAGIAVLVGGLGLVWFIMKCQRAGESIDVDHPIVHELIDDEFEKGTGPRKFSYSELARATNNFQEGEKLGEGGFGGVYKGFMPDLNSYVAVKRISSSSKQGLKEYASEVKIISRLRHRNLVQLVGWCHERKFLLVYEFMPNGSLDSHLFKEQSLLTWEARYKIAQGLASGLLYLHQEWEQCVLHRDIKSSNVMLDSNFNAKLGDFGLARLVDHGKQSQTTILAGTMGYMAPDYINTGKASKESDVYSFGVVALEIACGRKPIDPKFGSSKVNMVEWVWELYGEDRVIEAADPKLCGDFDEKQMECLMIVGLWCAHPDSKMRPSIQQAIQVLNFEVPLPNLPSKMPVATYFAPPKFRYTSGSKGGQNESSGYGYNTDSSQFSASSSTTNSYPKISLGS